MYNSLLRNSTVMPATTHIHQTRTIPDIYSTGNKASLLDSFV